MTTQWAKLWGYIDFKMTANDNAPTQPKFNLGITGIIHNVFQSDQTTKQKNEKLLENNNDFPREGGGGGWGLPLHGKFHENN